MAWFLELENVGPMVVLVGIPVVVAGYCAVCGAAFDVWDWWCERGRRLRER